MYIPLLKMNTNLCTNEIGRCTCVFLHEALSLGRLFDTEGHEHLHHFSVDGYSDFIIVSAENSALHKHEV